MVRRRYATGIECDPMIDPTSPPPRNPDQPASRPALTNPTTQGRYNLPPQPPSQTRDESAAGAGGRSDSRPTSSSGVRSDLRPIEGFNPPPDPPGASLGKRLTARPHTNEDRPSGSHDRPASESEPTARSESTKPSGNAAESTVEPGDYTVKELKDELEGITDSEELEAMFEREENDSNRRTAKEAIRRRMRTLDESEE